MRILGSKFLIPIAAIICGVLFWFRPGSIEGPRAPAVMPTGKGFDHRLWGEVLKAVVDEHGQVDYGALRDSPDALDRYLGMIRAASPASAPHRFRSINDRLAYYLNAYNAFVLAAIRDICPLDSISDAYLANGFFWRVSFLMGEEEMTLSDLESERIRGVMQKNPIVHFALVKGARGFAPLSREPFEADGLDAQLDALARRIAQGTNMVKRDDDVLVLNQMFQWYQNDFVDVETWLKRYAPTMVEGHRRIAYQPFDWRLNGRCAP
ncbi:MAG: DUF547 domain-containing protein [Myxococcota bacterium]|nr:DUF547 domain-containing protein [Myxococcota bacterium]